MAESSEGVESSILTCILYIYIYMHPCIHMHRPVCMHNVAAYQTLPRSLVASIFYHRYNNVISLFLPAAVFIN